MKKLRIAFDVDDCLILPPEATGLDRDTPNYETIAILKWFQAQGHEIIVWSGGGVGYAGMWAEKLGLVGTSTIRKEKLLNDGTYFIDIAFDDCDIDLAAVNVKVKRLNNGVERIIPSKRIK